MKYFIDTAVQADIEKWADKVEGATSNPSLLKKAGISAMTFFENNRNSFKNIFVQVASMKDVREFVENEQVHKSIIFKVPMIKTQEFDGYQLLKDLNKRGMRTCSTIVYNAQQFTYACDVGSEFSIALYAKNTLNPEIIQECSIIKERWDYDTEIIAASFRSPEHVHECIVDGADGLTIPPTIMEKLFSDEKTLVDFNNFYRN